MGEDQDQELEELQERLGVGAGTTQASKVGMASVAGVAIVLALWFAWRTWQARRSTAEEQRLLALAAVRWEAIESECRKSVDAYTGVRQAYIDKMEGKAYSRDAADLETRSFNQAHTTAKQLGVQLSRENSAFAALVDRVATRVTGRRPASPEEVNYCSPDILRSLSFELGVGRSLSAPKDR